MENKYKNIPYVLGAVFFVLAFMHFNRSNYAENTRYKQGLVDDYDSFYEKCNDLMYEKGIYKKDAKSVDEIIHNAGLCETLNKYSKEESKEVIHDIFYPEKEHITKDCDGRGCVYSN